MTGGIDIKSGRLTPEEIESLRKKNTEELLEAAEVSLEWLESIKDDPEAMKRYGVRPENIPHMIENAKKAIARFSK